MGSRYVNGTMKHDGVCLLPPPSHHYRMVHSQTPSKCYFCFLIFSVVAGVLVFLCNFSNGFNFYAFSYSVWKGYNMHRHYYVYGFNKISAFKIFLSFIQIANFCCYPRVELINRTITTVTLSDNPGMWTQFIVIVSEWISSY